jgi:SAM-dependent methyltransferase
VDPLVGSPWSARNTVEGFARAEPNRVLVRFAAEELARVRSGRALDIGCGAARNASALSAMGWDVLGTDLSWPMLCAARERMRTVAGRFQGVLAPMEALPVASGAFDLIIAHGIWNLADSGKQFRRAVDEAARAAAPRAALFVFTFSRNTLPPHVAPVAGESFVFTEFSGDHQCFLTEAQLDDELHRVGFVREPAVPRTEYNRPTAGMPRTSGTPVIYEAAYRYGPHASVPHDRHHHG